MKKIKFNHKTMSIEVIDEIPYDYIEIVVQTIKNNVKSWINDDNKNFNEYIENNIEECTDFVMDVERGLFERNKIGILYEIENEFNEETNSCIFQPDPFNENFLKRAIIQYVAREWAIDMELLEKLNYLN